MNKKSTLIMVSALAANFLLLSNVLANSADHFGVTSKQPSQVAESSSTSQITQIVQNTDGLSPKVVALGLKAHQWAISHHYIGTNKDTLTLVDFTKPSNEKRLWVVNLKTNQVLLHTLVAQGKNSGKLYAERFSNKDRSLESSPGVYSTANTYHGKHGYAMRLHGLEKGINSNAMVRDIVVHSAHYVTPAFVKTHGYAGRSWGCFAVNPVVSKKLINLTKDGSVIFAYSKSENQDPNLV